MAVAQLCACCRNCFRILEESFQNGDGETFFKMWDNLGLTEPVSSLYFQLHVYFCFCFSGDRDPADRFSAFLQRDGARYSHLTDLTEFYALPYIASNAQHPLLLQINQQDWKNRIKKDWIAVYETQSEKCHQLDDVKLSKLHQRHLKLKTKYSTLRNDYKSLLELATQLTKALENSLKDGTRCVDETVENYYEKISTFAKDYGAEEADNGGTSWRWEASTLNKCDSTESIASEKQS